MSVLSLRRLATPWRNDIDRLSFDTTGWTLSESTADEAVWFNEEGDALTLTRVDRRAALPRGDEHTVHDFCRDVARRQGAGLVSASSFEFDGGAAIALIYGRAEEPAFAYTGMIFVQAEAESFGIAVASLERRTSGARGAMAIDRMPSADRLAHPLTVVQETLRTICETLRLEEGRDPPAESVH